MTPSKRPRVIVLGAGFGGLWAIRDLRNAPVEVLLVDRHNYHTFLPLLYQVAAAEVDPEEIAYPVRSILRGYQTRSSSCPKLWVSISWRASSRPLRPIVLRFPRPGIR